MINIDKRLDFLIEKFNIFLDSETDDIIESLESNGYEKNIIYTNYVDNNHIIAIRHIEKNKVKVKINENALALMLNADPTPNKIYLEWLLTILYKLVKNGEIEETVRFITEDLPKSKEYLKIFDGNKRKKLFKKLSLNKESLKHIKDLTNINQYKSLEELFEVIDPFIEKDSTGLLKIINNYVNSNQAIIPVKDNNYTVYIPLTTDAAVIFDKFVGWCTSKPKNGMFKKYTNGNKRPNLTDSKLYIIINNKFFNINDGNSETIPNEFLYQIHFETNQIRDRLNRNDDNFYDNVLKNSEVLLNYFYNELKECAKMYGMINKQNKYLSYLIKFGYSDVLFELLDNNTPIIKINDYVVRKLPDMSNFKNLETLYLGSVGLEELSSNIFTLPKLSILSVPNNKIKKIPKEIGKCKNLIFINIIGNKINEIPDEIKYLDSSHGGNLYRISLSKKYVGLENYNKLKELLPNVLITERI